MMKKYYTAVGCLESRRVDSDMSCPVVRVRQKECYLDLQEMLVWSSLNWRFLELAEVGACYENARTNVPCTITRSWEDCLQRLMVRGLVVTGTGQTDLDALYDLTASLVLIPTSGNFGVKLLTSAKLLLWDHIPCSAVRRLFRRDKRTPCEAHIMQLTTEAKLSVAEVIKCIDLNIHHLSSDSYLLEHLYNDDETTSDNIEFLMKSNPCASTVTISVANLYLRQQLVFDAV